MIFSTATPRLRPSDMLMHFTIPMENLGNYYVIETRSSVVFDLNLVCMLVNYAVQHVVIIFTSDHFTDDYDGNLNWVTFAAALISCIGTVASLIAKRNRPPHKGRWCKFLLTLLLVASSGYALDVQGDPRPLACLISNLLLYLNKANSLKEKRRILLGDRRVPIVGFRIRDEVIIAAIVRAEHAHLVDSLYQGGRNVAFSVSSGEGVVTNITMREE
ncbi:hypothetical protein DCAR_0206727 [Daucus carota subsp. sativus]|uniref:Uncharacterized protein n=2 Tax=Daucus carota subsp. sativus TaxID=79200 RepID=A0AAF0WDB2_DAUCS|nr:PREDICTED: uncharacterized protein LOC108208236 [Daucus carota subsp. sativus]WOG87499.1 hypothetical protein DCAR_0206727 [Daucus carota subsp. sativus]